MHLPSPRFRAAPLCLVGLFVAAACDGPRTATKQQTVEVAPAHFVTLTRTDEVAPRREGLTELNIPWNAGYLRWKGYDIPFILRSSAGRLYMVTFDRHTDFERIWLRYYRQNNAADGFDEIGHG